MKLYILRHGDAAEHGDPRYKENERPLTPKGIQRTKQLAHVLREMEITFEAVLSSPLTRARETAEILARGMKLQDNMRFSEHLSPSG
ncbi:MAG TPA: histidine phosphatase family protein, partial [Verrucomicrobiae bacterium]|nr:histidine phosphatase family protein [Verrucomicrobiae bacterium]